MNTLGELYDALAEIRAAEKAVADARRSVSHGGNEDTMRWKHSDVAYRIDELDRLRSRPLSETDIFIADFFEAS